MPNKMVSPKVLNLILALQVLVMLVMYVNALPITSKPIENTAENLAWQAWLMLPPEQKSLEKSRKVTPKSIFTLPFRECPPGHHLFENRCIPTVQIDQTALLTQELLGFVDGLGGGTDNNYEEFDYDDLGGEIVAEVMYEPAQKLNGNNDSGYNDTSYDQLPSQDEPLKFNIFQQKFPTDYESVQTPSEEAEQQQEQQKQQQELTAKSKNSTNTPLAEAVNALAMAAPLQNATNVNADLQMESSNVSANVAQKADDIVTPTTAFSISDIDALLLPATAAQHGNGETDVDYLETKKQNVHKFSLFKDDSSVQLVTTSLLADRNNENSKQPDFTQLLKADDLLPLPNVASTSRTTTTTATTVTTAQADNEVPTLSTSFTSSSSGTSAGSTTTLLSSSASSSADNDEVTDMMLSDVDATMPTIPKEIDYKKEIFLKKAEHPRSVTDDLETEAQESSFMTTTEAADTTNIQLDETTIVEMHDAPTIALKELLELASQPHPSDGLSVVKKSKVEPVELPPIIIEPAASETTAIITTETTTIASENQVTASSPQPTTMVMTPKATPSLAAAAATATGTKTTDRFDNYQQEISTKTGEQLNDENDNNKEDDKLNFRNTETTATTTATVATTTTTVATETTKMTAKTSEIDIEQELRMINELVKGNKKANSQENTNENNHNKQHQQQQHQHQLKAAAIKSATVEAESGSATTTISASTTDINLSKSEESSSTSTEITTPLAAETTSAATASASAEPSTSTIWSKIMPLLGFSGGSSSETLLTAETTKAAADDAATTTATPKSISSFSTAAASTTTKSNLNTNISNNRSNRNSKIIRINSLNSFSSLTNSKAHMISGSSIGKQLADKLALSAPQSSQMVTTTTTTEAPTSTTTTTEITTTEIVEISDDSSTSSSSSSGKGDGVDVDDANTTTVSDSDSDQGEPFWWLPIGWRLDRANEPSLLLRFWSALPGQGD